MQSRSAEPIRYRQESATGPHHDRSFVCSVWQGEKKLGQGVGKSKKSAESQAAREALDNLQTPAAPEDRPSTLGSVLANSGIDQPVRQVDQQIEDGE